jgi:hypothetical protein
MSKRPEERQNSVSDMHGGIVRGILRQLLRNVKIRAPLRSMRDIMKNMKRVLVFRKQLSHELSSTSGHADGESKAVESRAVVVAKATMRIMPSFVKSTWLGSVLFSQYGKHSSSKHQLLANPQLNMLLFGAIAGVYHGGASLLWDTVALAYHRRSILLTPSALSCSVSGTLVTHGLSYGLMFASYEYSKMAILAAPRLYSMSDPFDLSADEFFSNTESSSRISHRSRQLRIACVVVAGGTAGVFAEVANHYLEPIEREGWLHGSAAILERPRPARGALSYAILPSAIGFLAFEYGKGFLH